MRTFSGSLSFSQSAQFISLKVHFLPKCAATTACLYFLAVGTSSIQESKEFVDLLFWKIGVVCGVLDFKSVGMVTFTCHDVGKRVETGVTHWDPDCVVSVFLEQLNEYAFAIEATFTPSAKGNLVYFFQTGSSKQRRLVGVAWIKDYCISGLKNCVWVMLLYTAISRVSSQEQHGDTYNNNVILTQP